VLHEFPGLLDHPLDAVLHLPRELIDLALVLELLVTGKSARGFLDAPFDLVSRSAAHR